ncbi:MAG: carboxypeptidase regulatory-like domain-containing protein [Flavobacteriales bacterium]
MKDFKHTLLALYLLLPCTALSQTGKITGIVSEAGNGLPMDGAGVYVEGIQAGKSTNGEGRFTWELAPGKYTLICKFIMFETIRKENIEVVAGQTVVVDFSMAEENTGDTLGAVNIREERVHNTVNSLLLDKFESANPEDVIGKDEMKTKNDNKASDVLKRVSGTTIQDNKFAIIRGMNDRYNAAYLNGAPLPSSESDRKAISFDIFPSAMLDNIIIKKSGTPDLPGEFAGGVILINTRSIPEENSQSLQLSSGINTLSTFKDFKTYEGGKLDWLGLDDGTRAIPEGTPETDVLRDATVLERGEYAKLFTPSWRIDSRKALPNLGLQYSMAHRDSMFGKPIGFVLALNYTNNNTTNLTERNEYEEQSTEVVQTQQLNDYNYINDVNTAALLNVSFKPAENTTIRFNNMYSINSNDRVTIREGAREFDQTEKQWEKASIRWFTENKIYSGQLQGSHDLLKKERLTISWNLGLSNVQRDIPNMRRVVYSKTSADEDDPEVQYAAVIDANNSRAGGIMFFSNTTENIYSGKYDVSYKLCTKDENKITFDIKAGGLHQYRGRAFSARNIGFDRLRQGSAIKFDSELLLLPEDVIFSTPYLGLMVDSAAPYNGGFAVKETTKSTDSYTASATLHAGYVMGDVNMFQKVRVIFGARVENYNQKMETEENSLPVILDTTVTDILPSVNVIYTIMRDKLSNRPKMNLRMGYFRSVSRPEFRELAKFNFYDFISDFEVYGANDIQRALIDNYDVRLEYTPGLGQLISVSGFYKKITNAIEMANRPDILRAVYYTNAPLVTNIGAELEYRFSLSAIFKKAYLRDSSEFLNKTYLYSNIAYIDSRVDVSAVLGATAETRPLQGQSPYVINTGVGIWIPFIDVMMTTSYNYVGRRLYIVGSTSEPDYWENTRHVYDIQFAKSIKNKKGVAKWDVRLNFKDIMAQDFVLYQDLNKDKKYSESNDNTMVRTNMGRMINFSIQYNF